LVRAEEAEAKNKRLEQKLLEKSHEILEKSPSLQHKLGPQDADLEKAEDVIAESKADREAGETGETSKMTNEGLSRKIQLLKEELDAAEKNVKETVEKCVAPPVPPRTIGRRSTR
jgi:tropomyosin